MKYFEELSDNDKERALTKLLTERKLKFNCLTRARVLVNSTTHENCSVVKYYFNENYLKCDIILDSEPDTIIKNVFALSLGACSTPLVVKSRTSDDIHKSKKALVTLLTSGKHYVFDHKCNAYPV